MGQKPSLATMEARRSPEVLEQMEREEKKRLEKALDADDEAELEVEPPKHHQLTKKRGQLRTEYLPFYVYLFGKMILMMRDERRAYVEEVPDIFHIPRELGFEPRVVAEVEERNKMFIAAHEAKKARKAQGESPALSKPPIVLIDLTEDDEEVQILESSPSALPPKPKNVQPRAAACKKPTEVGKKEKASSAHPPKSQESLLPANKRRFGEHCIKEKNLVASQPKSQSILPQNGAGKKQTEASSAHPPKSQENLLPANKRRFGEHSIKEKSLLALQPTSQSGLPQDGAGKKQTEASSAHQPKMERSHQMIQSLIATLWPEYQSGLPEEADKKQTESSSAHQPELQENLLPADKKKVGECIKEKDISAHQPKSQENLLPAEISCKKKVGECIKEKESNPSESGKSRVGAKRKIQEISTEVKVSNALAALRNAQLRGFLNQKGKGNSPSIFEPRDGKSDNAPVLEEDKRKNLLSGLAQSDPFAAKKLLNSSVDSAPLEKKKKEDVTIDKNRNIVVAPSRVFGSSDEQSSDSAVVGKKNDSINGNTSNVFARFSVIGTKEEGLDRKKASQTVVDSSKLFSKVYSSLGKVSSSKDCTMNNNNNTLANTPSSSSAANLRDPVMNQILQRHRAMHMEEDDNDKSEDEDSDDEIPQKIRKHFY